MKTLIFFGLMLLSTISAQCQYFQRHVYSRFEMNYIDTTKALSSFKGTFPKFKQIILAVDSSSVNHSKRETSQGAVFQSTSLEKAIQYRLEYKKRKLDLSPLLHILFSVYETQVINGCKTF